MALKAKLGAFAGFGADVEQADAGAVPADDGLIVNTPHDGKADDVFRAGVDIRPAIDEQKHAALGGNQHAKSGAVDTGQGAEFDRGSRG